MKHFTRRALALTLALLSLLAFTSCNKEEMWYYKRQIEAKKKEFVSQDSEVHVSKYTAGKTEPHEFDRNDVCRICGYSPYTQGLTYTLNEDNSSYTVSYKGKFEARTLIIPMKHDGLPVTDIAAGAFKGADQLATVTLPETIVEIGDEAFAACTRLVNVTISGTSHLWRIGAHAFDGAGQVSLHTNRTAVTFEIPESVEIIDDYAFANAWYLVLGLPAANRFEKLGAYAFREGYIINDSSLVLGSRLTTLGEGALSCASKFSELCFTEECPLTEIPDNAVTARCGTVSLSSRITRIGENNFSGAETVIIPRDSALTEVADSAFANHRPLIEEFLQNDQAPAA